MNPFLRKTLGSVGEFSNLLDLAASGIGPDSIKEAVIDALSPYFTDKNVLQCLAADVLVPEAVNAQRIATVPWAQSGLVTVLGLFRKAAATDETQCIRGLAAWQGDIERAMSEFYSIFCLELDKGDLPLEEFRYEALRNIGSLIEGCRQPFLKDLLLQVRIGRGKECFPDAVGALSLGNLVGELFDTSDLKDLMAPPPWKIRLNQWRNIAQHHDSSLRNGKVVVGFLFEGQRREVELQRNELLDALSRIFLTFGVVRMARTIFAIEHADQLRPHLAPAQTRRELGVFWLATALAAQGFELTDLQMKDEVTRATVRDVTSGDLVPRMAHAMQFPYPIWQVAPSERIEVTYLDSSHHQQAKITAVGRDCAAVKAGEIPFAELARRVKLEFLDLLRA